MLMVTVLLIVRIIVPTTITQARLIMMVMDSVTYVMALLMATLHLLILTLVESLTLVHTVGFAQDPEALTVTML